MNTFNYSFIIPHKNSVSLLKRCVDSIPNRPDVQLIIVDDNSEREICEMEDFPGLHMQNAEVYFTKEGLGAGYARNVGLRLAKGRWVLFADADDYYATDILETLDQYVNSDLDVVYFSINSDEHHPKITKRLKIHNKCFKAYNPSIPGSEDRVKYMRWEPWNKMISMELIRKNNIKFEEIKKSNDMIFSLLVSFYAHKIVVLDKRLYYITYQENSLTYGGTTPEAFVYNIRAIRKKNCLLSYVNHKEWKESLIKVFLFYLKKDGVKCLYNNIIEYIRLIRYINDDIKRFKIERLLVNDNK